jgi:hypothetical protein
MLCTGAANSDSAFHTKLRLNACELQALQHSMHGKATHCAGLQRALSDVLPTTPS